MLEMILIYLLLGVFAGLLAGLLGLGGGVLVVPGLAWVFSHYHLCGGDYTMQMAVATSLAIMVLTTGASCYGHLKKRIEFWSICKMMMPGVIVGAVAGALLSTILTTRMLEILFGAFIVLVAVKVFFHKDEIRSDHCLPAWSGMVSAGSLVGAVSSLLGLGGGIITMPFLLYCGVNMRKTIVVSVVVGLAVACIGAVTYVVSGLFNPNMPQWSLGYVYLPALICVVITSFVFARIGAHYSHRVPVKVLKRLFAIVLLVIGVRMF